MIKDYSGVVELVRRPSWRSGTGRVTLREVWKWPGDPPGGPEVVEDPPGGGTGRETLPEIQKWSGDAPESPELVERPSRRS